MFSKTKKTKKLYCVICGKYINLKNLKYYTSSKKQFFLLFAVITKIKMKKYLKENNQLKY